MHPLGCILIRMTATTRDRLRGWLVGLGMLAVLLAVQPGFEYRGGNVPDGPTFDHLRANPGDLPYTEEHRFGWWFSPLVRRHSERTLTVGPDRAVSVNQSFGTVVDLLSASGLTLAAGVGLLWAARRLRPGSLGERPA